jgi:CRP-like cAMP-binding protein
MDFREMQAAGMISRKKTISNIATYLTNMSNRQSGPGFTGPAMRKVRGNNTDLPNFCTPTLSSSN